MLVLYIKLGTYLKLAERKFLGAVFKPSDILRGRKRFVEELTRDLDASKREAVMRILESWREERSEDQLRKLVGQRLANKLLTKLKPKE